MDYFFPQYLLAKQAIDDRALNRHVLDTLLKELPSQPVRVVEVGAGMGNMLARLLTWEVLKRADYVHVDSMAENIAFAMEWLPKWATDSGMCVERLGPYQLRICDVHRDVCVTLVQADVMEYISANPAPGDLLIAHAFLDLLPMPQSMPKLLSLTRDLAWLTINFDGVTALEPEIDRNLDDRIERLYHESMDMRPTGGDSRSGRHLFDHLRKAGAQVLAAGASDWVVHPAEGGYLPGEAYFLHFILHFFEEALTGNPGLDQTELADWLKTRHEQVNRGELIYIAHQIDFLARRRIAARSPNSEPGQ